MTYNYFIRKEARKKVNNCYLLPRDRQLEEPVAYCELCGCELYEDETAYFDDGSSAYICGGCLEQWAKQNLSEVIMGDDY